jgi:DNA-binding MarR family transcriptional regulator
VATELILALFRADGLLVARGDVLSAEEGLTSARWQVLGAVALDERPLTVPQIARRMGLTRQSVHASVNRLVEEGLLAPEPNVDHRRSPVLRLTKLGMQKYAAIDRRQVAWVNELASSFAVGDLQTAVRVLEELSARLEQSGGPHAAGVSQTRR